MRPWRAAGPRVRGLASAQRVERFAGFLVVTRPLELGPMLAPLVDAGIAGKLVIDLSAG